MVGSAVATMVWSSAPRNIASMMPPMIGTISPWLSAGGALTAGAGLAAGGLFGFGVGLIETLTGPR
jgi:hypothetical protein